MFVALSSRGRRRGRRVFLWAATRAGEGRAWSPLVHGVGFLRGDGAGCLVRSPRGRGGTPGDYRILLCSMVAVADCSYRGSVPGSRAEMRTFLVGESWLLCYIALLLWGERLGGTCISLEC